VSAAQNFWQSLPRAARSGLIGGALAILLATAGAAWWLLRVDYQALFVDLKPQDAQAMTAELERLKIPYRLGEDGASIWVDRPAVHATRLKLMGKDLQLHGAVGLELFNNTDFGMTEFAQKINYQRALQGELTRTIQSLSQVRDVRVLLALPEQGLFKQAVSKAKASITLVLREGQALRANQVAGIQRLVAAAVPGMAAQDVTIVDGQGLALTRPEGSDADAEPNTARLELKRDTESYLAHKVGAILDRSFGAGEALASVDVTLNMDQIRTTTEDVLPSAARAGLQATGVIVREREVLRDAGAPFEGRAIDTGASRSSGGSGGGGSGSSQREVEYAVGRRVEQMVSQPGSVRRIQVVAVVRKALDAAQEEQLRKVIAAAVGASTDRGDTVVVQSLAAGAASGPSAAMASTAGAASTSLVESALGNAPVVPWWSDHGGRLSLLWSGVLAAMAVSLLLYGASRRSARLRESAQQLAPLSERERAIALRRVRDWMSLAASPNSSAPSRAGKGGPSAQDKGTV
jgi:flagellar M-ring protein FliF